MPQKVLRFTGINRRVSEFQSNGACEELINLRPTVTGLEVVRPKKIKFDALKYDVYNHTFSNNSIFVGIWCEQDTFEIYIINDKDGKISEVDSYLVSGEHYSIAFVGNQMVICNDSDIHVYSYKDGKYEKIDAAFPDDLDISYTVSSGYGSSRDASVENSNPQDKIFKSEVVDNWSASKGQSSKNNEIFGPILVAFNFSLNDGTEAWTSKWMYINPFTSLPVGENGKNMIYYQDGSTKRFTFNSFALRFTVAKKQITSADTRNLVKCMNVYASVPVFPYDIDSLSVKTNGFHEREIYAQTLNIDKLNIANQLMYYQKSIPISDIESKEVSFELNFGDSQSGEKVLEVDGGPVRRAGEMASYNNRIHFYKSISTIFPQSVYCYSNIHRTAEEKDAYVHLDCNDRTIIIKTKALVPAQKSDNARIACFYPDARAKKILIGIDETDYCTINLSQSQSYNFAWGETYYTSSYDKDDTNITSAEIVESNTINVSAQYNPFVCPIKYSYSFGGRIIDVSTSFLPISSTQIGQYPLSVFTTSGIYALEQGGGSSLYGNVVPLQPLVLEGKTAATPQGTFFMSSSNLYVLSGRESACISYALDGPLEMTLRQNESYQKLCFNDCGKLNDFTGSLSSVDFSEFADGALLTYDQLHNEIIISSNKSINYSYVFNLDTKAFHKIPRKYIASLNGSRYTTEVVGSTRYIVDMHNEQDSQQPVLLQSRPMPLEMLFTHIQRMILLVDTKLEDSQHLCLSVFGSDNLHDWKCIISSQKHDAILRHIRTNKAAKSYRDYIILINGYVSTDTDISDLIVDYTVVNRRLG